MSTELIVSLITAGLSAAASVIAALIQAGGKGNDKGNDKGEEAAREPVRRGLTARITKQIDFGEAGTGRKGVDAVWLVVAILLAVETIALGARGGEGAAQFSAELNAVILIPAITLVLALARPIGWGYAAGTVTLLHLVVYASGMVLSRGHLGSSPQVFVLAFLANALLVGGIAFLRTRARPAAIGGTLVACGVAALAWLFVPMLIPRHGPGPHPEPGHEEPGRDEPDPDAPGERPRIRPVHVRPIRAIRLEPAREPEPEPEHVRPSRNFGRESVIFSTRIRPDVKRVRPRPPGEGE